MAISVDRVILGLLMSDELSGYDIKGILDSMSALYPGSFGSIYPALAKLLEAGLVSATEQPTGGRQRKVYRITESGRRQFTAWLSQPLTLEPFRDDSVLKIFFHGCLERAESLANIDAYRAVLAEKQRELETLHTELEECAMDPYRMGTLEFGIAYYAFQQEWLGEFIRRMKQSKVETRAGRDCRGAGKK